MRSQRWVFVSLLLLALSTPAASASGQLQSALRYGISSTPANAEASDLLASLRAPRTYWLVGAVITAVPAMIAFNIIAEPDKNTTFLGEVFGRVFGTALVGAVFAVPGAVIGGLFPKD